MRRNMASLAGVLATLTLLASACGSSETATAQASEDAPVVVVTTNILGDVVANLVGDQMIVETVMAVGADPHDFQASAQQVAAIESADVLVANGAGFEEGLLDVVASAASNGVPTFEAMQAVSAIDFADDDEHDEHDEDHDEDEDHDDHGHEGDDPHFFTDPARMAVAADGIADFLIANVEGIDADALRSSADAYIGELEALDAEVTELLAGLSDEQRVLITNHEVFGYFADNYDFEVVGTVIPSGSTLDGTSAESLVELVEVIQDEGVAAIFSDTSSSDELVQTLADEVGDIAVVELFTESLGDADSDGATYIDMVRFNATSIAEALAA